MESPGEIKSHKRRERGKEGKVGSWKVESPDKLQGKLHQGWKRERSWVESPGFGREACQSVVRARRGFKILPDNDAKML
jgi:hypothetical protein